MKLAVELMRNLILVVVFVIGTSFIKAQEINGVITINADQVSQTNQQVFKTLERSLNDFLNKTKWTNKVYGVQERINARMQINITAKDSDRFDATLQIQSSRPIYNSSYETPIFNFNDKQFKFDYQEFQPIFFNANAFESNLVSVVSYYVYIILGLDADTFALEGGTEYFEKAQSIVSLAQGSGFQGWKRADGNRTRFELVDNLLSNTFREYRILMYNYHRKGLDVMADKSASGKQAISGSMRLLEPLSKRRPNAFLIQAFFDAKSDEIKNIFSDGPKVDVKKLLDILNRVAPFYASTWKDIKY